jgi:hypothetical protein
METLPDSVNGLTLGRIAAKGPYRQLDESENPVGLGEKSLKK